MYMKYFLLKLSSFISRKYKIITQIKWINNQFLNEYTLPYQMMVSLRNTINEM